VGGGKAATVEKIVLMTAGVSLFALSPWPLPLALFSLPFSTFRGKLRGNFRAFEHFG
jgi:hypothetical protein